MDAMPSGARLWVHVADRELGADEQERLRVDLEGFLAAWSAHGASLSAAGAVLYGRVVVVALDEERAGATGCSIDKLVGFLRAHGEQAGVDWFDRHQVLWRQPGDSGWKAVRTAEFWALRKAGVVTGASEVVDPLAATLGEARRGASLLVKSFDESWHAAMWS